MGDPRSLASYLFQRRVETVSTTYWQFACASEYATRHWQSIDKSQWPTTLSRRPGDDRDPFRRRGAPSAFLDAFPTHLTRLLSSAILDCVTTFEVYLYEILVRGMRVKPSVLEDSDLAIKAKDLVEARSLDVHHWLALTAADKYVRNRTHKEVVGRISTMFKIGIDAGQKTTDADVVAWHQWTIVRNALAHAFGRTTDDLVEVWPSRFPVAGKPLGLEQGDLSSVSELALRLMRRIDERFCAFLGTSDSDLLASELFVRFGLDAGAIAAKVVSTLGGDYTREQASRLIAQIKSNRPVVVQDDTVAHVIMFVQ